MAGDHGKSMDCQTLSTIEIPLLNAQGECMAADQGAIAVEERTGARPERARDMLSRRRGHWRWIGLFALILAVGGAGALWHNGQRDSPSEPARAKTGPATANLPRVQVVTPIHGGMERVTNQPGTIRAFEYANLYTKVSGFLKTLNVDRGSRVKKGDLLASRREHIDLRSLGSRREGKAKRRQGGIG
jgi:hypothetical protein